MKLSEKCCRSVITKMRNSHMCVITNFKATALLLLVLVVVTGCKKDKTTPQKKEDFYGYGKLTVDCEKKCHVTYGVPGKMNDFDVEASRATYYFRYQINYNLNISITPVDEAQTVVLRVFNREEKQIFQNSAWRNANEVWSTLILVP